MKTMTKAELIEYVQEHGHAVDLAHADQATICAEECVTKHGVPYTEWVLIPANLKAVRDWLGY